MQKINLVLVLTFLAANTCLHAQCGSWQALTTGITSELRAVHFPTDMDGWAVGANGVIIKTSNGGTTWSAPQTTNTTQVLHSVHFISGSTGWAVGARGTILKTTNGGTSWASQTSGTTTDLFDVWFNDANNGWIAGACGLILRTTNGGTLWTQVSSAQSYNIKQIKVLTNTKGIAATTGTTQLYTTNSGAAWSGATTTPKNFRGMDLESGGTGFQASSDGSIVKSTNYGVSWTSAATPTGGGSWQVLSMATASDIVVAGLDGKVFRSTTGGSTWVAFNTNIGTTDIYGLQMRSSTLGYAVGEGGKVYKYTSAVLPDVTATATNLCQGSTATLQGSSATSGVSWAWTGPGNFNSSQQNASITAGGQYILQVTNPVNGCVNADTVQVAANPAPTAGILPSAPGICPGGAVTLTGTGTGNYLWSGGLGTGATALATITGAYTLSVTNVNNCTATATVSLTGYSNPVPDINGTLGFCQGSSSTLSAGAFNSYLWSTGATGNSINVTTANTYTVTVTNAQGCTGTDAAVVTVGSLPNADAGAPQTICSGQSAPLMATGGTGYVWSNGLGNTASVTTPPLNMTTTYIVTVTNSGCTSTDQVTVTVNVAPTAGISPSAPGICPGSTVTLTGSGTGNYLWSGGLGMGTTTLASTAGAYTLTVTNANNCSATASVTLSAYTNPAPDISGTLGFCQGSSTTLSVGNFNSYLWSTGATGSNSIIVTTANTYAVTVTNAQGCTGTDAAVVTVGSLPNADAGAPQTICSGQSAPLMASGGTGYQWSNGLGNTASVATPPLSANTNYTVTVSNNGCTSTDVVTITVNASPTAGISTSAPGICPGSSVTLTGTGTGNYLWSGGLGTGTTALATTGGTYTLTVTNAANCSTTASVNIAAYNNPVPNINGTTEFCLGENSNLSVGIFNSYLWSTGATGSSINVNAANTYAVTVTNAQGCSATDAAVVTVFSIPVAQTQPFVESCADIPLVLMATGGGSYTWSGPGGVTGEGASVTFDDPLPGYYVVTVNINNCEDTAMTLVSLIPFVNVQVTGDTVLCSGDNTVLTAIGQGTFIWDDSVWIGPQLVLSNLTSDVDHVVSLLADNGCMGAATVHIEVNSRPNVSISGDTIVCIGDTVFLAGNATGGNIYEWYNGNTGNTIQLIPAATTIIWLTVNNAYNCPSTDSVTIQVQLPPVADAGTDQTVCDPDAMMNASLQPGGIGIWSSPNNNDLFFEDEESPVTEISGLLSGDNLLVWMLQSESCPGISADTLKIFYNDIAPLAEDDFAGTLPGKPVDIPILSNDNSADLPGGYELYHAATTEAGNWSWDGTGLLHFEPADTLTTGDAVLQYILCSEACPTRCDTANVTVRISSPDEDVDQTQVITPNGDGENDELYFPYLDEFPENEIEIYNRWGSIVYGPEHYDNDWAGTGPDGSDLPQGTYYYILRLALGEGEVVFGNVLLVR